MRNLKRVLSLTLASVMLLGMMVVGSSAAGYPDVDDDDNVEAIEVLQAIGVMVGDDNGNFGTDNQVTRAQMAVIMAKLMNLNTYITGTNPFNDVPEWARDSVAACYANGIVSGYNSTTYGASDPVTAVQAASMLMRALGYFQYTEDYKDGFELSTIRQAGRIDLFNGVGTAKATDNLTRNQVAQIVLNTLKSGMVEPDDGNKFSVNVGGTQVSVGATNYVYIVSREKYAASIRTDRNSDAGDTTGLRNAYIVDLGEKLFQGDLTLNVTEGDDLGRPANHWEYKTKEIGTYAADPDYAFSSQVTSKKLYDTVGSVAATNYQWVVSVNGIEVEYNGPADKDSNRDLVKNRVDDATCFLKKAGVDLRSNYSEYTDNGVVTEIYVDDTVETDLYEGRVTVAVYNLYAAEVMRVLDKEGTIILTDLDNGPANATHEYAATGFNEDDVVVYTFSEKADEIQAVALAERIEGEITRVRTGNTDGKDDEKSGDLFVVNDNKYNYNATVSKGERLQTDTVNNQMVGYLDEFGYCIYIDRAAISYEYAYVLSAGTDQDRYGADPKGKTIYARLAFTDGTTASVETDNAPGKWVENGKVTFENKIVSYSKNSKGVYTLTPATNFYNEEAITQRAPKLAIDNNVSSFTGVEGERYSANSKTAFVLVTTDDDSYSGYSYAAYTGVANVPNVDGKDTTLAGDKWNGSQIAVATEKGSRVAKVVFVLDGNVSGGEVFFIRADKGAKLVKDSKIGNYYEISAWVDGEAVTLNVKTETSAAKYLVTAINEYDKDRNLLGLRLNDNQVIFPADTITRNADELVTGIHTYMAYDSNNDGDGAIVGMGTDKTNRDTIVLGEDGVKVQGRYTYENDAVFTQWTTRNNNGRFELSRANAIKNDSNDKFIAVTDGDVITGICVWYIPEGEGEFVTKDDDKPNPSTPVFDKDNNVNVSVGADDKWAAREDVTLTITNKGTAFTADGWYYMSIGDAEGVQKAGADGSLSVVCTLGDDDVKGLKVFVSPALVVGGENAAAGDSVIATFTNANGEPDGGFISVIPKASELAAPQARTARAAFKNGDAVTLVFPNGSELSVALDERGHFKYIRTFAAGLAPHADSKGNVAVEKTQVVTADNDLIGDVDVNIPTGSTVPDVITLVVDGPKAPGVRMTTKINLGNGITATVEWTPAPVDGMAAEGVTYTSKVTLDAASADKLGETTTVVTAEDKAYTVTKDAVAAGDAVVTAGEMDTTTEGVEPGEVPEEKEWTITISGPAEGVTGVTNGQKVKDGNSVTITPVDGYTVVVKNETITQAVTIVMDSNLTITVTKNAAEEGKFNVTVNNPDGVAVGVESGEVEENSTITVKAVDGYTVTVKIGEAEAVTVTDAEGETFTVTDDVVITVTKDEEEVITVTVKTDANSTGEADKESYKEGDKAVVKITVDEGYRLLAVMAGEEDVTSKVVLNATDNIWTYTITGLTESVVIDVTTEKIPDNLTLNLRGLLQEGAAKKEPTVKVSVVNQGYAEGKTLTTPTGDVMQYAIPEGAQVVVKCDNPTSGEAANKKCEIMEAGDVVSESGRYYLVGETLVFVDAPNYRVNTDRTELEFTFTMGESLDLNIDAGKNFVDAKQVIKVTSEGGAELKFWSSKGTEGDDTTVTLPANGEELLPVLADGTYYKVKVVDAGEGSVVRSFVNGKADSTNMNAWKATEGVYKFTDNSTKNSPKTSVVFKSCIKIGPDVNVEVNGEYYWEPGEVNGVIYVPVGGEITLKYKKPVEEKDQANYPTMAQLKCDGFVVMTKEDYANGIVKNEVVADGGTITVTEPVNIGLALKFVLGEDVEATYEYTDAWTGKAVKQELTAGTWYGPGYIHFSDKPSADTNKPEMLRSYHTLSFSQKNVVCEKLVGNEADIIGGDGNTMAKGYATATYIKKSQIWNGAEFDAWTRVESKYIDEGYLVHQGVKDCIFNDVYMINPVNADQASGGVVVEGLKAWFERDNDVFFLSPKTIEAVESGSIFFVIGGDGNVKDENRDPVTVSIEGYEIQMNGEAGGTNMANNPFGSDAVKTAWGTFDSITVDENGVMKLEAVAKSGT